MGFEHKTRYIPIIMIKNNHKALGNIKMCSINLTNKILNKKLEHASVHIKFLHKILYLKYSQAIPNQDF